MIVSRHPAFCLVLVLFLGLACDSGETNPPSPNPAMLTVSPSTLDFGSMETGQISVAQTITIRNTGDATLNATALTLGGNDADLFQMAAPSLPFTLTANASESIEIAAAPTANGAFAATLTVASNGGSATVALSGIAMDAPPVLDVSPSSLDFGSIQTGQTSAEQTVTMQNTGGSDLTVSAMTLSGTGADQFRVTEPATPLTIAAGASADVQIVFEPTSAGSASTTLSVQSDGGTQAVALSGSASDPLPDGVSVTYLGNDGIMLAFEDKKVLIDAIHTNESPWVILPTAERTKLLMGQPPYDDIDLVLVTHNHGDHYSPSAINTVLLNNPKARVIAPPQAVSGIDPSRIEPVDLTTFGTEATRTVNGITLDILLMHHFDQFDFDFSNVQNFVYRITLDGKHFLHVGDVEYETANFQPFDLATRGIEAIFMPTFNTLISEATRDLINAQVAPNQVVALHFWNLPSEATQVQQLFPDAILFTEAPTTLTF